MYLQQLEKQKWLKEMTSINELEGLTEFILQIFNPSYNMSDSLNPATKRGIWTQRMLHNQHSFLCHFPLHCDPGMVFSANTSTTTSEELTAYFPILTPPQSYHQL